MTTGFLGGGCLNPMDFQSVKYFTEENGVAHILLNRPEGLNAIDFHMPAEIEASINLARWKPDVKAILPYGAGDAFCSGYDLKMFAEGGISATAGDQKMPWDPLIDFQLAQY
ncbi:3-hydroxypropionyl-coenzyme A dehydratase [Folsomia candida]|uniref:3-hydroxypropionyl-coenzyme A dehydratase n=1 Tax=Folsomia candida TaxID=158441 RepID=A0A226D441_FOLCA|nr:3-hydroxypropionyl-coenzyme A dehydratase [Folsomia candida]